MICAVCGESAVVRRRYEDLCRFHYDCLYHEIEIILDAIRDFGPYGRETGPTYGLIFYGYMKGDRDKGPQYAAAGYSTLGWGLHLARTPQEAMTEAMRIAKRNNWKLLRLDVQAGAARLTGMQICTNLFVSEEYAKYMKYSDLGPLPYDAAKYGAISA